MRTTLPDGQSVGITASFGVTSVTQESINLDGLMQQTDHALYGARLAGCNRVLAHL